jgi:hypothetical protein
MQHITEHAVQHKHGVNRLGVQLVDSFVHCWCDTCRWKLTYLPLPSAELDPIHNDKCVNSLDGVPHGRLLVSRESCAHTYNHTYTQTTRIHTRHTSTTMNHFIGVRDPAACLTSRDI